MFFHLFLAAALEALSFFDQMGVPNKAAARTDRHKNPRFQAYSRLQREKDWTIIFFVSGDRKRQIRPAVANPGHRGN